MSKFCNKKFHFPIKNGTKRSFCQDHNFWQKKAILQCVPATVASELLSSSISLPVDCKFEPEDFLEDDCGQLLQDKLEKSCGRKCQDLDNEITSAADAVEEVYTEKKAELDILVLLANGSKSLAILAKTAEDIQEARNHREKLQERLAKRINNDKLLTIEQKVRLTEKMKAALAFGTEITTSHQEVIDSTDNEIRVLQNQQAKLDVQKSKLRKEFDKMKRHKDVLLSSKTKSFKKASNAVGQIAGSVEKFKKGGTWDVMGGILDVGNAISNFLPPPASILTSTVSSIFELIVGGAPSTEDVVKEEFEKQKKYMEQKFTEINKNLGKLEQNIAKLEKSIKTNTQQQLACQSEVEEVLDMTKNTRGIGYTADGILDEIKEKDKFIIAQLGQPPTETAIEDIINSLDIPFKHFVKKSYIKKFVRKRCKGRAEAEIVEACQVLAYSSLAISLEEEKLIDRLVSFIGSSTRQLHAGLIISLVGYKENVEEKARSFLKEIFTSADKADFFYLSCALSDSSLVKLAPEQKQQLINYGEHLECGLGDQLEQMAGV